MKEKDVIIMVAAIALISMVGLAFHFADTVEQDGLSQLSADTTDYVQMEESDVSGSTSNTETTDLDEEVEQSYMVFIGQEGSSAMALVATDEGNVLDGYVTLKIAYAYYAAELGFLVSAYDYVDVPVIGWNNVVMVKEDLSSRPYYSSYFNMTATYHSYDGSVQESSSKIVFEPN